jgi:hypothetical protein
LKVGLAITGLALLLVAAVFIVTVVVWLARQLLEERAFN